MSKMIDDGVQGEGPMASINVTSLVDVMFCLLIMFMVSAPMMAPQTEVELTLPKATADEVTEDDLLLSVISIDVKGRVYMGSTPLADDPAQIAADQGDPCALHRHIGACSHREADVRLGQRGGVVDPVPRHRHGLSGGLEGPHSVGLFPR